MVHESEPRVCHWTICHHPVPCVKLCPSSLPSLYTAPSFVRALPPKHTLTNVQSQGEAAVVRCYAMGNPPPVVWWEKGGQRYIALCGWCNCSNSNLTTHSSTSVSRAHVWVHNTLPTLWAALSPIASLCNTL